jgi:hypothetical protein
MALHFFNLKDGIPVRDRKGHECANDDEAIFHGTFIAQRIGTERPDYAGRGHYISVVNEEGNEIHRAPIESAGKLQAD